MPSLKTEQYSKTLERVDFDVVSKPEKWRFLEMQCAEFLDKGVPVGVDTETTGLSARWQLADFIYATGFFCSYRN